MESKEFLNALGEFLTARTPDSTEVMTFWGKVLESVVDEQFHMFLEEI